jgi:3-hydroxybutyryl-CoA dehydrogenase
MQIVVLANEQQRKELTGANDLSCRDILWINSLDEIDHYPRAGAFIDLLFVPDPGRLSYLRQLLPLPVIINSVCYTLEETDENFIRINGWPTFLAISTIEASAATQQLRAQAENIFAVFEKMPEWLPDITGFITPRVISMIINEAFFALQEGISTREEINTAMKLGTNYPHGPFEWASLIGLPNITRLLQKLALENPRYSPCKGMLIG